MYTKEIELPVDPSTGLHLLMNLKSQANSKFRYCSLLSTFKLALRSAWMR